MKSRTSSGNVMESTPLQMGGGVNPSWWSIRPSPPVTTITSFQQQQQHHHHPSYNLLLHPSNKNNFFPFDPPNSMIISPYSPQPTSSSNSSSWHEHDNNHQQPQDRQQQHPTETWSQQILGGMDQDEGEKQPAATAVLTQQLLQAAATKLKIQSWEESQVMLQQTQLNHLHDANYLSNPMMDIKQEHHSIPSGFYNMLGHGYEDFLATKATTAAWSSIVMPSSPPPKSCVTSFGNNNNSVLDFSSSSKGNGIRQTTPEHPSESNSSASGGASKKARVQPSPPQSNTFKVRKEKLGDRITALHQLVSPFGKTDTASVLLETMGYIRFLQGQIEALSLPYLGSGGSGSTKQHRQLQMLDSIDEKDLKKDLKSRGLCLVPVSCTLQVGSDNGADYWAPPPTFGGGFN